MRMMSGVAVVLGLLCATGAWAQQPARTDGGEEVSSSEAPLAEGVATYEDEADGSQPARASSPTRT
jgi:hypothetical protein